MVLSDGAIPRHHHYRETPGFSTALAWSSLEALPTSPDEAVGSKTSYLPAGGESKFLVVTFPPDSVFTSDSFDPEAAYLEQREHLTGLIDHFDPERPGMHATPTLDYGIVLSGSVWLELDDGVIERLDSFSVVVQQGNVHAWRNQGTEPAMVAFVLIGQHV
ncbi:cupin domain-containing protein [Pseudomonas sp. JBR1]|uniref:cupin domain-containing protein n=1 Tax=Pseudomonas sp. JBR1 TaxID=3020907 RepID=UPI002304EAAE|nr:cupin domain-containing protein [Pseudomonas sp. JBR1]WCE09746.1 cupin domain-containing protein [Pseudomonas sp. JBR1]